MSKFVGRVMVPLLLIAALASLLMFGGECRSAHQEVVTTPDTDSFEANASVNQLHDLQRTLAAAGAAESVASEPATTISIQVLDSGDRGVSGAEFSVASYPDGCIQSYHCDTEGRATLQFSPPVELTINVTSSNKYRTGYSPVRVVHGEGHVEVSLEPTATGVVTGKVMIGGEPASGVSMTLYHDAQFPETVVTDTQGWYLFAEVAPGTLSLRPSKPFKAGATSYSLAPAETAVIDFIIPNHPLVIVLHDPESSKVYEGVKIEVVHDSYETGMRTEASSITDVNGTTAPYHLGPGFVRWRVLEGGESRLPGFSGEFEWAPDSMESEVFLPLQRDFSVVELLIDEADHFSFRVDESRELNRVPQVFLLAQGRDWFKLNVELPKAPGQRLVQVLSQQAGTVAWIDRLGASIALGEFIPGQPKVRAEVKPATRLQAFVTRPDGIFALNFKCVSIVDATGQAWPTSSFWLTHGNNTSSLGRRVTPAEIAILPVGHYTISMASLSGETDTKTVEVDGVTPTQTVWFQPRR